jgi:predicted enzyme related to lactoylglutathione lyase
MRGEVSWNKLATTDHVAAFRFYSALFGWETLNEQNTYRIFGSGGVPRGGMFNKAPHTPGEPGWWIYVRVQDLHRTMQTVKAARGTVVNGPIEAAGGDRTAQFLDPYGALFAVHTVFADLNAAQPTS